MDDLVRLSTVCEELLTQSRKYAWDAGEGMNEEYVRNSPLGRLIGAFGDCTQPLPKQRLSWLVFFTARRALPCWDAYCDTTEPHIALAVMEKFLLHGVTPPSWIPYTTETFPSYKGVDINDCRWCDTSCASGAVAEAAKFIETGNDLYAMYAVSGADMAFDQSPLGRFDNFRQWLLKVAVPVAYEAREMTFEEQNLYREFDPKEIPSQREQRQGH